MSFATGPGFWKSNQIPKYSALGSIPWFFVSEIFPTNARGHANSIACMTNWMVNACVGISFEPATVSAYQILLKLQ